VASAKLYAIALFAFAVLVPGLSSDHRARTGSPPLSSATYPDSLALNPPMGWNSYDSFGGAVNEQELRANARYLADHLASHGWKYLVVDYYWYFEHPETIEHSSGHERLQTAMDEYGRLLPAPNRFPSSAGGKGFKPLADYVHSLGLKFGIHIMRGIPRQAVELNLRVLGTNAHAKDIAELKNTCPWSTAMYGVDVGKPAGQAYYDSIARLYASWGVDFIKADDMSRGNNLEPYHGPEIEALRRAMSGTGRPMVLSLSPGAAPLDQAANLSEWSQMWRISDDMWDKWQDVRAQFARTRDWARYSGPNHWPDADMLPLGWLRVRGFDGGPRRTRLTRDEQLTLMTLWCIFRSPLIMGGDLTSLDPWTLSLLENDEVLAVDQASSGNRELFERSPQVAWEAVASSGRAKYVALFDTGESAAKVTVTWKELGLGGKCSVRDLWAKRNLGLFDSEFSSRLNPHAAGLYRVTPAN
jgi:alpha-galactosidase